jgi:hypothetical protein
MPLLINLNIHSEIHFQDINSMIRCAISLRHSSMKATDLQGSAHEVVLLCHFKYAFQRAMSRFHAVLFR